MKKKKMFSIISALILAVTYPMNVMADDEWDEPEEYDPVDRDGMVDGGLDDFYENTYECFGYDKYDDHIEILRCFDDTEGDVVVPETITDEDTLIALPVTYICDGAFSDCTLVTSVTIPDSVTAIGERVFSHCESLREVDLPDTVIDIPNWTFRECSSLEEIVLHPGINTIGYEAFAGCSSLTSIHLPEGIERVRWGAFMRCPNLAEINFPDSLYCVSSEAFNTTAWFNNQPDGLVYAGHNTCGYKGQMPENAVITIADGTTSIGGGTFFAQENLAAVNIPDTVTHIAGVAFGSCSGLAELSLPDSLVYIGEGAFANCTSLTTLTIPDGVEEILGDAFMGCSNLRKVTLPNSIRTFGSGVFDYTAIYDAKPDGEVYFGKYLYGYKGKMDINTHLEIKPGTLGICDGAFFDQDNIVTVRFPESLLFIGTSAFASCKSLCYADLPENLISLGNSAFSNCSSLKAVAFENPDCEIFDLGQTICNLRAEHCEYNFSGYIRGAEGSTAQLHAEKYALKFTPFHDEMIAGDANCDGEVNIADSIMILQFIGNKDFYPLTIPGQINADVCGNDGISTIDALAVQMVALKVIDVTALPIDSIEEIISIDDTARKAKRNLV